MPSFDIVSKIDHHELTNAIDQANREISNRFDFKGTDSRVDHSDDKLILVAPAEFQVHQVNDILQNKMAKRGIDIKCLQYGEIREANAEARQEITLRQGIDKELAKKLIRIIKDSKLKVQASIQGDQVRVSGKKRDDLQAVISMIKESKLDIPMQYENFRD